MFEINKGYEVRLKEYRKKYQKSTSLFEEIGSYLNENFNWAKQSAFSQEEKPKYRLTLKENVSLRPNITVMPYKDHVQIRVAYLSQDEAVLNQSLPECFEKKIFKDKNGNDASVFVFNIEELDQLKNIDGMDIDDYFSPKAKKHSDQNPGESSDHSDRDFTDEIMLAAIKTRRGQPYLRKMLLKQYNNTCIVTGCRIVSLLEAAHIVPHSKNGSYNLDNALLLRSDIHNLFDSDLLSIDGNGFLHVSVECQGSEYEKYKGIKILEFTSDTLKRNLQNRFEKFMNHNKNP